MYLWQCTVCDFAGHTQVHKTHHIMYHLMADTLLIELFNEAPPDHYPLEIKEIKTRPLKEGDWL